MAAPVVVSRLQNRRGTQDQFDSLYPPGYTGTGGVSIVDYPEILLPGEIALCTDSRRVFMGNINGEYVELSLGSGGNDNTISLLPITILLPPAATFTVIPELTYSSTPFYSLLYGLADAGTTDWDVVGSTFSRNGELLITATETFTPIDNSPFPPITPVNIVDTGTEVNTTSSSISFIAGYSGTDITISYKHNFSSPLTFSTSAIRWLPF